MERPANYDSDTSDDEDPYFRNAEREEDRVREVRRVHRAMEERERTRAAAELHRRERRWRGRAEPEERGPRRGEPGTAAASHSLIDEFHIFYLYYSFFLFPNAAGPMPYAMGMPRQPCRKTKSRELFSRINEHSDRT